MWNQHQIDLHNTVCKLRKLDGTSQLENFLKLMDLLRRHPTLQMRRAIQLKFQNAEADPARQANFLQSVCEYFSQMTEAELNDYVGRYQWRPQHDIRKWDSVAKDDESMLEKVKSWVEQPVMPETPSATQASKIRRLENQQKESTSFIGESALEIRRLKVQRELSEERREQDNETISSRCEWLWEKDEIIAKLRSQLAAQAETNKQQAETNKQQNETNKQQSETIQKQRRLLDLLDDDQLDSLLEAMRAAERNP